MKDEIVILAVTKMLSGFCIGGISLASGKWVRPVKERGTILLGDIKYADGSFMRPFDVVSFELGAHRPKPPHIEDWTCDFVHERPRCLGHFDETERRKFCRTYASDGSEKRLLACDISLTLCPPVPTAAMFSLDEYSGKYDARILIPGFDQGRGVPVTDLKWRALGRELLKRGANPLKLSSLKLKSLVGVEAVQLAFGLSRIHENQCWPMVIGVHTFPDYQAEIDYREP